MTSPRDTATIEHFEEELLSGVVFARHAASHRSVFGYQPPVGSRQWARAHEILARLAGRGDAAAQFVACIMGHLPLYQSGPECAAKMYELAAHKIRDGYDDVHARTGPEPCRHSDAQRRYAPHEVAAFAVALHHATAALQADAGGIGWCLAAVCKHHGVPTT